MTTPQPKRIHSFGFDGMPKYRLKLFHRQQCFYFRSKFSFQWRSEWNNFGEEKEKAKNVQLINHNNNERRATKRTKKKNKKKSKKQTNRNCVLSSQKTESVRKTMAREREDWNERKDEKIEHLKSEEIDSSKRIKCDKWRAQYRCLHSFLPLVSGPTISGSIDVEQYG